MENSINLTQNAEKLKRELISHIPLGTPVEEGKLLLEENGFQCSIVTNGTFYEAFDGIAERHEYNNLNFLYAKHFKKRIIGLTTWQLAFPYDEENLITNVLMSVNTLAEP